MKYHLKNKNTQYYGVSNETLNLFCTSHSYNFFFSNRFYLFISSGPFFTKMKYRKIFVLKYSCVFLFFNRLIDIFFKISHLRILFLIPYFRFFFSCSFLLYFYICGRYYSWRFIYDSNDLLRTKSHINAVRTHYFSHELTCKSKRKIAKNFKKNETKHNFIHSVITMKKDILVQNTCLFWFILFVASLFDLFVCYGNA